MVSTVEAKQNEPALSFRNLKTSLSCSILSTTGLLLAIAEHFIFAFIHSKSCMVLTMFYLLDGSILLSFGFSTQLKIRSSFIDNLLPHHSD